MRQFVARPRMARNIDIGRYVAVLDGDPGLLAIAYPDTVKSPSGKMNDPIAVVSLREFYTVLPTVDAEFITALLAAHGFHITLARSPLEIGISYICLNDVGVIRLPNDLADDLVELARHIGYAVDAVVDTDVAE